MWHLDCTQVDFISQIMWHLKVIGCTRSYLGASLRIRWINTVEVRSLHTPNTFKFSFSTMFCSVKEQRGIYTNALNKSKLKWFYRTQIPSKLWGYDCYCVIFLLLNIHHLKNGLVEKPAMTINQSILLELSRLLFVATHQISTHLAFGTQKVWLEHSCWEF